MSDDAALHKTGTYRYLPAIDPYSSGVAAQPGFEIIGLRFDSPLPVARGFDRLDAECAKRCLPASSIVGIELRSGAPVSFGGFDSFNTEYRGLLASRGLLEDGINPIARTNVVPLRSPPVEPVLFSAFIVQASREGGGSDFVVAGAGEISGSLDASRIVSRGDTSQDGLLTKAIHVLDEMRKRLVGLGKDVHAPTQVNVYTAHEIEELDFLLLDRLAAVETTGFTRWIARPPVVEVEFEMDLRRVTAWEALC